MNLKIKNILLVLYLFISLTIACSPSDNTQDDEQNLGKKSRLKELVETEQNTEDQAMGFWEITLVVFISLASLAGTVYFFYAFVPLRLWYEGYLSGVRVSWGRLIIMRWQRVPQEKIMQLLIKAKNARLILNPKELSDHYLAKVDIEKVVDTLIRATNARLTIQLNDLAAQYLAKVDVERIINALIMASNAQVETSITELSTIFLAGADVEKLIKVKVAAKNSGYAISLEDLRKHMLAGGNVEKTVDAFVAAKKAKLIDFDFHDVAAIDLSGMDVIKAVNTAINPIVVETAGVRGVARDGVEIIMKVKITLRAFIRSIIGGISPETVLARVNEGLATEIGMSESHFKVLESPFELADRVQKKNLNVDSAFEILSIDVSDMEIGKDIHAELKTERAKADAEMAKAELIRAEEKVQKAMAAAFLDGKLSVHEYHQMMNTEADTHMRKKLGDSAVNKRTGSIVENNHKKDDSHGGDGHH